MALLTDILDCAARECSVSKPSSWLTTTSASAVALRDDHLRRTAADILDRLDLPSPVSSTATLTGDGKGLYYLPSDFRRVQADDFAVQEATASARRVSPILSDGEWSYLESTGNVGANRVYRLTGYPGRWYINFLRVLGVGETVTVNYVTENWLATSGGTAKSVFSDESDVALVPRELLEVGTIYRFRRRRGLPHDDVKAEYETLIARWGNNTRGRQAIAYGKRRRRSPFDIPVPDTIPSS